MTEWKAVRDSREETPEALDTTSSRTTVYERRNIRREIASGRAEEGGAERTEWAYEQREYTAEEYASMISPATQTIMRAISGLELSVAELAVGAAK